MPHDIWNNMLASILFKIELAFTANQQKTKA